jgi:hypothetical protein
MQGIRRVPYSGAFNRLTPATAQGLYTRVAAGIGGRRLVRRSGEEHTMNNGEGQGKLQQIRGQARQWWGQWRNRHLYRAGGQLEPFVAVLQTKYGYTRAAAEDEFYRRMAQFEAAKPKHKKNVGY